jgi:hypothetical protein
MKVVFGVQPVVGAVKSKSIPEKIMREAPLEVGGNAKIVRVMRIRYYLLFTGISDWQT